MERCENVGPTGEMWCSLEIGHAGQHIAYALHDPMKRVMGTWGCKGKDDLVRVLRLVEYCGPRHLVEEQIQRSVHGTRTDWMRGQVAVTAKTLGIWPDVIQDERRKPDPRQLREMADLIEKMAVERGKLLSDVSERIDLIKDLTLENTDLRDMASRLESELREAWSKIDSARVDLEGLMSGDQISGTFITEAEAEERIQEEIRDYIPEEFNPERLDG